MMPIEQLLWRDPEENAAMVRNLNAQAEARARRINAGIKPRRNGVGLNELLDRDLEETWLRK